MKTIFFRYTFFIAIAVLLLASCKVTQPYQSPVIPTDSLYRNSNTSDTTSIGNLRWDQLFTDPTLQALINTGIQNNIDLQVAFTRIQQAQAYYSQSKAAFLPSLDANAGVTSSKISEAQGLGIRRSATQYQVGVSTAWELDIWGKLKSSRKASLASLLQTEAAKRAVQTQLVADIANYYYLLLALDQQLTITSQTVNNWDTTVQTMRALKEAARVTEAAVVQSEAQRYAAEVTIPDLRQSIRETENLLSILLGSAPNSIPRTNLQAQQMTALLQTGVPAQLLANRPDVLQAELNFRYYFELTNVARTYFYPTLSITGSTGLNALTLGNLFEPSSFVASIGAGLAQPIFNRKANKTRLEVAKLQQREALLQFKNALLNAGREVSDALSLQETALEKVVIRTNQMNALQKSVDYSQELLRNGFANYTEIITARQSLLQAELGRVNDRLQQLQSVVNLYRSLGGGWQ
jgi:NodT family efflux transporter outer membrane factor (OMF) lipoprotein